MKIIRTKIELIIDTNLFNRPSIASRVDYMSIELFLDVTWPIRLNLLNTFRL